MNKEEFKFIRDFIHERSSIELEEGKEYLVESRMNKVMERCGFSSIAELTLKLQTESSENLENLVVESLTTNETSFFRDSNPFNLLRKTILPEIVSKRIADRTLDIWCAASSSGQEPYSIAMILKEDFPILRKWKINFIASDISNEMLSKCREGIYREVDIKRGLSEEQLSKFFTEEDDCWRIHEDLRNMINFKKINLAKIWPVMAKFDLVLMRNVLIYFSKETKVEILEKVKQVLKPDGYFLLGGSETAVNLVDDFERVVVDRADFYRLR